MSKSSYCAKCGAVRPKDKLTPSILPGYMICRGPCEVDEEREMQEAISKLDRLSDCIGARQAEEEQSDAPDQDLITTLDDLWSQADAAKEHVANLLGDWEYRLVETDA